MTMKIMHLLSAFKNDESGQDLIEYALVAGLIGLGAVIAMTSLGTTLKTAFTNIGISITSAT